METFGHIVYDVKESSTEKTSSHKPKFLLVENQYMLDQDLFEVLQRDLKMELTEDTKRSLVQYLGRKYKKDTIMFDYSELERLTKLAGASTSEESFECFWYLMPCIPGGSTD